LAGQVVQAVVLALVLVVLLVQQHLLAQQVAVSDRSSKPLLRRLFLTVAQPRSLVAVAVVLVPQTQVGVVEVVVVQECWFLLQRQLPIVALSALKEATLALVVLRVCKVAVVAVVAVA
jgi:hypothetical protein